MAARARTSLVCPSCGWKTKRVNAGCEMEHYGVCSCHYGRCIHCKNSWLVEAKFMTRKATEERNFFWGDKGKQFQSRED